VFYAKNLMMIERPQRAAWRGPHRRDGVVAHNTTEQPAARVRRGRINRGATDRMPRCQPQKQRTISQREPSPFLGLGTLIIRRATSIIRKNPAIFRRAAENPRKIITE
jgi:hypothetical protein